MISPQLIEGEKDGDFYLLFEKWPLVDLKRIRNSLSMIRP